MRKTKICAQEKLNTVESVLHGKESIRATAKRLSVGLSSITGWITSYKGNGIEAFTHTKNKHYSRECKVQAVTAYLNQEGSLSAISEKMGLRSSTQLRTWIKRYNSHEKLNASGTGGTSIMTKGRKTPFNERVEMVQYCIAHAHNYGSLSNVVEKYYRKILGCLCSTALPCFVIEHIEDAATEVFKVPKSVADTL